jgi:hypothetical protein
VREDEQVEREKERLSFSLEREKERPLSAGCPAAERGGTSEGGGREGREGRAEGGWGGDVSYACTAFRLHRSSGRPYRSRSSNSEQLLTYGRRMGLVWGFKAFEGARAAKAVIPSP